MALSSIVSLAVVTYLLHNLASIISGAWKPGLSQVPNAHWSVPYSRLWCLWRKYRGDALSSRLTAHEAYGPVVRVGPAELSVSCFDEGIQTIYGGNWEKTTYYSVFKNFGHEVLFSTLTTKPHVERKRMLSHIYSKTYVDNSSDLVEALLAINQQRLSPLLRKYAAEGTAVDTILVAQFYMMDASSAYLCGLGNASNWLENTEEAEKCIDGFVALLAPETFFLDEFPKLTTILAKIGLNLVPRWIYEKAPLVEEFGAQIGARTKTSIDDENIGSGLTTTPVVYGHLRRKLLDTSVPKDKVDEMVAAEMLDHLFAGHEAPGVQVSYAMWELGRNPTVQEELRDDLRSLRASGERLENSKILADILTETMRLYPTILGPFPRITPPQGARIGGFDNIPGGTVVSASPFFTNVNPNVFPNPGKWMPSRWSSAAPEQMKEMQKWNWAFSSGPRVCIGQHVALQIMKSWLATVYVDYKTTIARETDMKQIENLISFPKGKQTMIRFHALET